jgi:hypothetical protein
MSKTLIIGDEAYEYPDTGDINYGEEATGWAEAVTDSLSEIANAGDIATTTANLKQDGTVNGSFVEGNVRNLLFDTAFVQKIDVSGFVKKTYTDSTPDRLEEVQIRGVFNGSDLLISASFVGDDTEIEFDTNGGQVTFKYVNEVNIDTFTMKFNAKAIIDESFFE